MTKVYLGNQEYEIHLGHRKFILNSAELAELNEDCVKEIEGLNSELETMDNENSELHEKNRDLEKLVSTLETQIITENAPKSSKDE